MGPKITTIRSSLRAPSTEFARIGSASASASPFPIASPSCINEHNHTHDYDRRDIDKINYDNQSYRSMSFHSSNSHIDSDGDVEIGYPTRTTEGSLSNSQSRQNKSHLSSDAYLYNYRHQVGRFVESNTVEGIILLMIVINSIMMGIGTYDFVSQNESVVLIFDRIDMVFLICFTVELCLHLFHLGFQSVRNPWIMFDLSLILSSWIFSSGSIKAIRALRILKLVSKVEMFKVVIISITTVLPKMGSVAFLLGLIMFIFSIMFTQLFGDMYENGQTDVDYFSRLDKTMLTLFQLMTLDAWDVVVQQVMQTYSWSWIPFLTYITLMGIVVTNIVIAVICDSVLSTSKGEKEDQQKKGNDDLHVQIQMMQEQAMHLRVLLETTLLPIRDEFVRSESSLRLFHSGTADTDMEQLSEGNQSINSTGNKNFRANNGDHDKVEKPTGFRGKCGEFVNGKHVQILIMVLIITNSIMMAVGTFDFVNNNPAVLNAFDTVDTIFLTIYSVESILQVIYHGIHIYKDGWASFDLFLVLASWILSFTAIPIQAARSLRIVRVLRIVPKLKSLKDIITAVVRVFPNIGGIGGILFLFFYIFAIIFTELYKDKPLDKYEGYFSRLDTTMFTLFQIMTMVDWTAIARELWEHSYLAPALMSSFIILSGFIFLNLIVALICGAMESIHESVHEMDVSETMESSPTKNVRNINLGRLRNIEDSQKKMLHLLEMCTIAKDEKEGLGIVKGEPSMPPNCKDPERCPDTSS